MCVVVVMVVFVMSVRERVVCVVVVMVVFVMSVNVCCVWS